MSRAVQPGAMIGGRILDVQSCEWETGQSLVTVLIVRLEDGRTVQAEVWRDAEGNGPGFLSIEGVSR